MCDELATIKEVPKTMKNRRIFRTIARDICGESMEPSETEIMYFGYHQKGEIIACGSVQLADKSAHAISEKPYNHWVTFLFVKKSYQRIGCGSKFLNYLESESWNQIIRPIRAESAFKAVKFFQKCGYTQIENEPKETAAGSSLFKYLYLMEKEWSISNESWD